MTVRHDKLVRDRIPEIIEKSGKRATFTTLGDDGFRKALLAKLIEEACEVAEAPDEVRLSEFADLAEVLDAALAMHGFSGEELAQRRASRNQERGGFARRIYLQSVDE